MFDSVQVKFKNVYHFKSPLIGTRVVPFVNSYLDVLKSVVNDIQTEYFWFFASFIKLDSTLEILDYIPEQHEKDQIHVWYTTHPKGGLNKEGNVFLIPTKKLKEQINNLKFLRDFKDINYHAHPMLEQSLVSIVEFPLKDPYKAYNPKKPYFYKWLINKDLGPSYKPNFYPSFWEDEKIYTFGKTKDIMLVPHREELKQFYDIERCVHYDHEYPVRDMDIIFLSYDEPGADEKYEKLKSKFPRAKRVKGIAPRTRAYHAAAEMSETDYFFAVFPTIELEESFDFSFQPDRLKNPCHYIFNCKNPVNGLEYGHRAVILYNKWLAILTVYPGLDFTLSQPHEVVPILCGTSRFNITPEISWRVAFREVIKLCAMKPTVESRYRLKKWCELGKGDYALLVQKGALDAVAYYEENKNYPEIFKQSYELDWLKEKFKSIS